MDIVYVYRDGVLELRNGGYALQAGGVDYDGFRGTALARFYNRIGTLGMFVYEIRLTFIRFSNWPLVRIIVTECQSLRSVESGDIIQDPRSKESIVVDELMKSEVY